MNKLLTYILFIVILASCSEDVNLSVDYTDAVEVPGVEAVISDGTSTRAAALDKDNYVGRSEFINGDVMLLTSIKRTVNPISQFTYYDIEYSHTDGSWNRNKETGHTGDNQNNPDRIYWSDAISEHTYVGYSLPQGTFDWKYNSESKVYYGSLGNPQAVGDIDYTNNSEDATYKTGNEKIKKDDLLLTYAIDKVAETGGSVAKLYYHHALAMVRVIVNIQGFAASENSDDAKAVVSDMVLRQMLTMYKWTQGSYRAVALSDGDDTILSSLYEGESKPTHNQRKDTKLWIPRPVGTGTGVGKQFAFYGLAVPVTSTNLTFSFIVTYPDPMNPSGEPIQKPYSATLNSVEFRAGYCTTINITLNHQQENMTIGAEYMDWQLVETPDEGELKKHDTFLYSIARNTGTDRNQPGVTIVGDNLATEDDATWLYNSGNNEILDIYGNDGTSAKPYTICTADQLLSFAYEVTNGRTFEGKYVMLDADIVLQPNIDIMRDSEGFYTLDSDGKRVASSVGVSWLGIGDASHAFNGTFVGGNRSVKRLYGSPFFVNIGPKGHIDALLLEEVLGVTSGGGAFAELNQGVICASAVTSVSFSSFNVVGKSETITYDGGTIPSSVAGSMVGRNEGVVFACHGQGTFTTDAARVGGLVGYNTGALVVSYTATKATTTSTAPEQIYRGIVGYNDYAPTPLPTGKAANEYGSITYCFFDKDIDNNVSEAQTTNQVYPKSTIEMKKSDFIGENDRYALMSEADKTLLESLARKDYNILVLGSTTEELTQAEKALRDRLLSTLDGTITYIAYHSYLCPKIINDAYADGGTGTSVQLQFLINHFLSHYYMFRVGDYPRVY